MAASSSASAVGLSFEMMIVAKAAAAVPGGAGGETLMPASVARATPSPRLAQGGEAW